MTRRTLKVSAGQVSFTFGERVPEPDETKSPKLQPAADAQLAAKAPAVRARAFISFPELAAGVVTLTYHVVDGPAEGQTLELAPPCAPDLFDSNGGRYLLGYDHQRAQHVARHAPSTGSTPVRPVRSPAAPIVSSC